MTGQAGRRICGILVRIFDAYTLNFFLNHPSINPHIKGEYEGYMDATDIIKDKRNYCFLFDGVCLLFLYQGGMVYEIDIYALPRKRGAEALNALKQSLEYMRSLGASIIAKIEKTNRPSQIMAYAAGFRRCHEDDRKVFYKWAV